MTFREWVAPVLVAGPCAIEGTDRDLAIAEVLVNLATRFSLPVVFKGSFDKANRSRPDSPRGLGLEAGLAALDRVKRETGLPILTDVHEPAQVPQVAEVVDAIQVPAFLCRQTDLLRAAGRCGKPVNIKKGQWMSPDGMAGAVDKVRCETRDAEIAITERGTFFGYGDLVVDMRTFGRIKKETGCTVLYDATHSVQRPGMGPGGSSAGSRHEVVPLLLAAAAAGADGFFVETHPDPARAPSDGATMLDLADLVSVMERTLSVWDRAHTGASAHA